MKKIFQSFLALSLLVAPAVVADCNTSCDTSCESSCESSCSTSCESSCESSCGSCNIRSVFRPRPQGADTARELLGWQTLTHKFDVCDTYLTAAMSFQYERSFHGNKIAQALFGTSTLNFVGSQVADRTNTGVAGCCNLVADYFGLSTTTNASLKVNPVIQNFIWDFNFYLGLDSWLEGLYFRLNLPVVWTSWNLFGSCNKNNSCDTGCNTSCDTVCGTSSASLITSSTFAAGYMSAGATPTLASFQEALGGTQFGAMSEAWRFGKFSFCKKDKGGVADLDMILGYDFWNSECGHFGLYIQAVAPTGPRPSGEFIFEPVVGTHHWKLGGGLSTHYVLWEDNCDQSLAVWLEGNVVHYFKDTQTRSFDFLSSTTSASTACDPLSRYLLLKEFNTDGVTALGSFINAINFNTRSVKIDLAVEGDASLKFSYRNCGWEVDLGYNIYGKSAEKGCFTGAPCNTGCTTNIDPLSGRTFGIKGTEGLYSTTYTFSTVAAGVYALNSTAGAQELLNSTQNRATMCAPTLAVNVDNAVTTQGAATGTPVAVGTTALAWNSATTLGSNYTLIDGAVNTNGVIIAQTSSTPIIFTGATDPKTFLSLESGLACSQITNKVFGLVNYIWRDCDWTPFLGLGATGEFAMKRDCSNCGLSKWSVLLKGGISF